MQTTEGMNALPTLWATLPDIDDVKPIDESDLLMFNEIKEVLERHGATHRFGITLLHRHFDLAERECLLESTDVGKRRQVIEVTDVASLQDGRVIETQWAFDGSGTLGCVGFCNYNMGHKHIHNRT